MFGKKKKKDEIFRYQKEGDVFAAELKGDTFLFIPLTLKDEREVSAHGSATGGGGSYRSGKERSDYEVIVAPSGSGHSMPIEEWRKQAGQVAKTHSGGAVLPEQVRDVAAFSTSSLISQAFLKPSPEYVISRIRSGLELYGREMTSPISIEVQYVPVLANTVQGKDFQAIYHPISEQDVGAGLQMMARDGEVRIEGTRVSYDIVEVIPEGGKSFTELRAPEGTPQESQAP